MANYVPVLRWKMGERIALQNLSAQGRTDVTPLLIVSDNQFSDAAKLARQVTAAWGGGHVYVDAADLPGNAQHHALDDIQQKAAAANLQLIPSLRWNAPPDYAAAVGRMIAADQRGVAFRISLSDMTDAAKWVPSWPYPLAETDLIVDLASAVAGVQALGTSVHHAFATLHKGAAWRSVTLAGGNIPENLTGYAVGSTDLSRSELILWKAVYAKALPYVLHFGDYTTVGPDAAIDNIKGPVPINAKYTRADVFQILHGVRPGGGRPDRATQYRNHAKAIVGAPGHQPLAHCWGDTVVSDIAKNPAASPGSPQTWVSYAINRHIEFTRTQLP